MQYTKKQIEMLERCSAGLVWIWHRDERGDEILHFLMDEGLIAPRDDIQYGLLTLTQRGEAVLENMDCSQDNQHEPNNQRCGAQEKIAERAACNEPEHGLKRLEASGGEYRKARQEPLHCSFSSLRRQTFGRGASGA